MEIDALTTTVEAGHELISEFAIGLAWAAGDPFPKTCSPDCHIPHSGPKANAAVKAAFAAKPEDWPVTELSEPPKGWRDGLPALALKNAMDDDQEAPK